MSTSFDRRRIPVDSRFVARVEPADDNPDSPFVALATFDPPSGATEDWTAAELLAGRDRRLSTRGGVYVGHIKLIFAAEATARVSLKVEKPGDGGLHSTELTQEITGDATRPQRVYFILKTQS